MTRMQAPPGAPEWLEVVTAAERPDLWEQTLADQLFRSVWPEYNLHGSDTWKYFPATFPAHAAFQILFLDKRTERIVSRGRTIGIRWDGSLRSLPRGIDDAGLRALNESRPPTAVCALAAEVDDEFQGHGLSELILRAMAMATVATGLSRLVVPVRPSMKERYPLMPIDRYAAWRRDDGLPFDSWLRVHARLGARHLAGRAPVATHQRQGGGLGALDGHVLPGERHVRVPPLSGAAHRPRRPRPRIREPNVWVEHDTSKVEAQPPVALPGAIGRPPAGGAAGLQLRQVRGQLGRLSRCWPPTLTGLAGSQRGRCKNRLKENHVRTVHLCRHQQTQDGQIRG